MRAGETLYRAEPGTAFLLSFPSDSAYDYDEQDGSDPWTFYSLLFSGEAVAPLCGAGFRQAGDRLSPG